jgi:hypothetical protein
MSKRLRLLTWGLALSSVLGCSFLFSALLRAKIRCLHLQHQRSGLVTMNPHDLDLFLNLFLRLKHWMSSSES